MKKIGIPTKELKAIEILNRNGVAYLLIGGYAMRFYGAARKAKDVDLLVRRSTDNAANLCVAIQEIIGHRPDFTQEDLLGEPSKQVRLKNDGYEMEMLTSIEGLDFDTANQARELAVEDGVEVPIVSREHLLLIKQVASTKDASRQEKELRDIRFLKDSIAGR